MTQSFDDFARNHESDRDNRTRLTKEASAEWEILKGLISQFALDGKGIGNQPFKWTKTITGRPMLTLGNVAAVLEDAGTLGGVPQSTCVRFSRRPPGSGEAYSGTSPVYDVTWHLVPRIARGEPEWSVDEHSSGPHSSAKLAEEIAKKLTEYHIEYERAYGREV